MSDVATHDRLSMTLTFAAILHAIAIFGIGFRTDRDPVSVLPSLDVILVQSATSETPDKADFLANAVQAGGGNSDEAKRPTEVFSSPLPRPEAGVAPVPIKAGAPDPITAPHRTPVLSTSDADVQVARIEPDANKPRRTLPKADTLMERSADVARLAAELDRRTQAYAKRPKRKFISVNTQEYVYANYMAAWEALVKRVGTLNAGELDRRKLRGDLVVTVAIRRDGSLDGIDIIRSSGHPLIDETALKTIELSAPFSPLPRLADEVDVLHITRTYVFSDGDLTMK